jgi:hypothetical protein
MIHLELRCAYNHIVYLILVYKIILSLRQAFQGLTPNGSICLPEMLKLREHQCSKDIEMFLWVKKELRILVSVLAMILLLLS